MSAPLTVRGQRLWRKLAPTVASFLAEASAKILAFVFFAVLARFAGPGVLGEVRAALSAGQIAAGIGVPFLTSVSRLGGTIARGPSAVWSARALAPLASDLTGWLFATVLGGVVAGLTFGSATGSSGAVFLVTIGFGCSYVGTLIPKSYGMPRTLLLINVVGNAAQLLLLGLLVVGLPEAVTVNVVIVVYACAFIVPVVASKSLRAFTRLRVTEIKTLVREVLVRRREYLSQFSQHISHVLMVNLDLLVLSVVASSETVGEYAAVKSIVMIVLLPATALFHLLLPAAVRRFDGTTTSEDQHILWAGVAGIAVAGAVAFVLGDAIMATLYGPRFAGLGPAVAWGAIGAALYGVSLLRGAVWIARGEAGAFSAIVAGAAILGAVFLFLFPTLATTFGAARVWAIIGACLAATLGVLDLRHARRLLAGTVRGPVDG